VRDLPGDLPAALFVVLHIPAQSPSMLATILAGAGAMPALQPKDGQEIEHGHIYVAPPDCHLLVVEGRVRVIRGPKENRHRPAIDPLFRSAAFTSCHRAVGVVLTGSLDDGTAGLRAIKRCGGIAVVQDPADAVFPSMPRSAIEHVDVDYIAPLAGIAPLLVQLAYEPARESDHPMDKKLEIENKILHMPHQDPEALDKLGTPSYFTCPECHGTLWEMQDGELTRFRCRVGHAYSADSMFAEHSDAVEDALWVAMRTLEESITLSRRMADRAKEQDRPMLEKRYRARAEETERHALVIRQLLLSDRANEQPTA
jgi:two-component system chemotaxis response regulator CheB